MTEAEKSALQSAAKILGRLGGRKGGLAHNPRKGFGTGDNARKAVLARWAKYRANKAAASN